jgi:hypothetical protein
MKKKQVKKSTALSKKPKGKAVNELNLEGLSLADIFAMSKYGTYGNAKATIIVGNSMPNPGHEETSVSKK